MKISNTMKAGVLRKLGDLALLEVPIPYPKEGEVLVKVGACGICGSDIRYFYGENAWSLHTLGYNEPTPAVTILGHEISGEVVEVGKGVSKDWLGKRVGVIAFRACDKCEFCFRGLHNLCANQLHIGHDGRWSGVTFVPGGYSEFVPVWEDKIYPIPDQISFVEATQLDGLAVAIHAVKRSHLSIGETVGVVGGGAIGLLVAQVAQVLGANEVFIIDQREKPLEIAKKIGINKVIQAEDSHFSTKTISLSQGRKLDIIFDTVGSKDTIEESLRSLNRAGRLILLATTEEEITLKPTDLAGERMLTTSANNLYPDYPQAASLLVNEKIQVKPLITHIFPLLQLEEAFQLVLNKEKNEAIKVVLVP